MTASPRLKCFIASAFGFEDVDRVYDRVVRCVLREQGVKALRVDRVEHNEDIDNQIFHLLNASQLCIADLTHARPSVYYEAGYATGKEKPVIYIVRSDHFRRRSNAEDPHGNLRVHFDLQMKNVISWDGSLVNFEKRLTRRLKLVLRSLKRPATADAEKRERDEFAKCSIHERQQRLEVIAKRALQRAGFRSEEKNAKFGTPRQFLVMRKGADAVSVTIRTMDSVTRSTLSGNLIPNLDPEPKRHRGHVLLIALRRAKMNRLERLLPSESIVREYVFRSRLHHEYDGNLCDRTTHIVSGVESPSKFATTLEPITEAIVDDLKRKLIVSPSV